MDIAVTWHAYFFEATYRAPKSQIGLSIVLVNEKNEKNGKRLINDSFLDKLRSS